MSFVGIDVGGTFLKGAVLTHEGNVGPVIRVPMPAFLDVSGDSREIDAHVLESAILALVGQLSADSLGEGVLVTGQMAGIAFVAGDGQPVRPLVSWQDSRAGDVAAVARSLGSSNVADLGDGLRRGSPIVTLYELGIPDSAYVTSIIGFAAGVLCGSRAPTIHATDAAAWGMYDVRHRQWSESALTLLDIGVDSLPSVSWSIDVVGTTIGQRAAPVFCAVGDQQAALLGAGLAGEMVSVNLATGCQVSLLGRSINSPAQLRPYFGESYLHTVTHLPGGRLLASALLDRRGSVEASDWAWAADHAAADPVIHGSVETIAQGVAEAVDRLGARGRPVRFSGGLVQRFAPVRERITDLLGAPATTYQGDDAALAGLATLCGMIAS